jgi:hypothetical protein
VVLVPHLLLILYLQQAEEQVAQAGALAVAQDLGLFRHPEVLAIPQQHHHHRATTAAQQQAAEAEEAAEQVQAEDL